MARFDISDFDRYAFDFNELANLPDSVIEEMLEAEGAIIRNAQSDSAKSMLQGPYYKGGVAEAATLGKIKRTANGKKVYVTFEGTQHGTRIAEIAFINEFGKGEPGKKNYQPARPFIWTANESHADEAVDAAAKIYDNYLKSKGL